MFGTNEEESRRRFLQQVGVGVLGGWSLDSWAGLAPPEAVPLPLPLPQATCALPAHGAATAFRRDCRPIRPRQVANRLTSAEVDQLKAAYQAMRALDTSDPSDPRGFMQQANVHCVFCATDPALQVHGSWRFFAWHRAYLYFHERILGKLINNENFRLPFWGWDSGFPTLPQPYVTPNNTTNPLFNPTRVLAPGTALDPADIGPTVINDVLTLGSFDDFGGTATGSGTPENSPHGTVHVRVGGNMGFFSTAARDPVFYQHHATVDKLWSDWNKASTSHTNPTDPAFTGLVFNFFDENKVWRSITAAQVLDHENSLRYVYEPYRFWDRFLCLIWRLFPIDWRVTGRIVIPRTNPRLLEALKGKTPIRLNVRGLELPRDRSAIYRIYASEAEAKADAGDRSPGFLGTVSVVLNDPDNRHPSRGTLNVVLSVRQGVRTTLARGEAIQPWVVGGGDQKTPKRAFQLRAADVLVSVGTPEREQ
jgi:polyphenol oxidase